VGLALHGLESLVDPEAKGKARPGSS